MSAGHERVAIVTGASRGLGLATARALSSRGWSLVIDARDPDSLTAAAGSIAGEVEAIPGDVTEPGHRHQLIRAAEAAGGLGLLINNASELGPSPQPRLDSYPLDVLRSVYEVNVLAPLALIQAAAPLLRQREGVVVNITSDAADHPFEGWAGYGSSKAALNQMTNILAVEEPAISVYLYDPGDMNTRMHQLAFPGEDISDRPRPEQSVPPLMSLIDKRPASGSYRVSDGLLAT